MFLSKVSVLFAAAFCLVSLSATKANEVDDPEYECVWTGPTCIDDCYGRPDGYYQWCHSRKTVAICSRGRISFATCRRGLIWDDNRKQCNETSTAINFCYPERETCRYTGWRCITSCYGRPDGDYQSCHGCASYVSCVGGGQVMYDYRPCALTTPGTPPLQWNDITKQCNYTSPTCVHCLRDNQKVQQRLSWSSILKK